MTVRIDDEAKTAARSAAFAAEITTRLRMADRLQNVLLSSARIDAISTLAACDDVIFALRDRLPEPVFKGASPYFSSQRAECESWAEFASDGQIAAMLIACLDRIAGARFLLADRKRLLVAVWNSLSSADRKAFRDRVMSKDMPDR